MVFIVSAIIIIIIIIITVRDENHKNANLRRGIVINPHRQKIIREDEELLNKQKDKEEIISLDSLKRKEFPFVLDDFIGQRNAIELLKLNLFNPKFSPLIYGKPGMGKSLLLELYTLERNRELFKGEIKKIGKVIRSEGGALSLYKIAELILELDDYDILYIDECHRLSLPIAERLLSVIQDKVLYGVEPDRFLKKANPLLRDKYLQRIRENKIIKRGVLINILIPNSVVICGATTELGLVPKPLMDRMNPMRLQEYSMDELKLMIKNSFKKIEIEDRVLELIIRNCQNIPRLAKRIISSINPIGRDSVTLKDIEMSLGFLEIKNGLTYNQRKYLSFLYSESPIGRKTIADYLGIPLNELDNVVEPWIKENGWVKVTSKGREVTNLGIQFCEENLGFK